MSLIGYFNKTSTYSPNSLSKILINLLQKRFSRNVNYKCRSIPHRIEILEDRTMPSALFSQFIDPNPSIDNGFGNSVLPLITGNVVITAPYDDAGGTDAGATYLFNGTTGELISSLIGSSENDNIGAGGVTELSNGNFVVQSPYWDNGSIIDAGAVTFGDGTTGVTGFVSEETSLIGSSDGDYVGYFESVTALTNGNYVVSSRGWDNGSILDVGAITFGNGTTGVSGSISVSNSLLGSSANDLLGSQVIALTNGNYVVSNWYWDNGSILDAGAVTFGDGTTGVTGLISVSNSLVGSSESDQIGTGLTALTNGNYVIGSPNWNNGSLVDVGAVTFGDGTMVVTGHITAENSLIGSSDYDAIGAYNVIALTNGNYVVGSWSWNNGSIIDAGAVTFGDGTTGVTGLISAENSLVGSAENDNLGDFEALTALTNGNYVISSPNWDNGSILDVGAVTFGDGMTGITGFITAENSLIGSSDDDLVGFSVTALSNGNYVVGSSAWDNGSIVDAGAVTFGDGTTGVTGHITAENSLLGSTSGDSLGEMGDSSDGSVTALANGNYVIGSPAWDNGSIVDAGAVTFGNGTMGVTGYITAENSLLGSSLDDGLGVFGDVISLTTGNYLVSSLTWDNKTTVNAGIVTFADGTMGISGTISSNNSLIGFGEHYIAVDDTNLSFYVISDGKVRVYSQVDDLPLISLDQSSDVIINESTTEQTINLTGIVASGYDPNPIRLTANSSNTSLIPDPVINYNSPNTTASLTFTPIAGQSGLTTITLTVEDGGLDADLDTAFDNGMIQRTFNIIVDTLVNLDLRVVSTPTAVSSSGEVFELPANLDTLDEWSSFWLEIWLTTSNEANQGIYSANIDLNYNSEYISASSFQFGSAFSQNQNGNIDDSIGVVENLYAEAQQENLGISEYLLFARIKFEPGLGDHVDIDFSSRSIGPNTLNFSIDAPQVVFVSNEPAISKMSPFEGLDVWVNPYDLNDDDVISFRDLILFASVYGSVPSESNSDYAWVSDFNQNNRVEFGDLILFASNYGKRKLNQSEINYPNNYPEAWNNQIQVSIYPQNNTNTASLSQSQADGLLQKVIQEVSSDLSGDEEQRLKDINIQVVDLGGLSLGMAKHDVIYIDVNAAGHGWFIDKTPFDNSEFHYDSQLTLIALSGSEAEGLIDLWTVIHHELGHLLGYKHTLDGVMEPTLLPGVRKIPEWTDQTDEFFASFEIDTELLFF